MLEEYEFWSAKKTTFWSRVLIMILIISLLLFAWYAWTLYQEKVQHSDQNSNQQSQPTATPYNVGDPNSTNGPASSLSPLTSDTNLN
jgi:uncharacterized membrane protein